jgi:hypothetical protein
MTCSHPRPAGFAALLLAVTGLAGCTSVHNTLGGHDSPCFRVLPAASRAVGGKGKYQGVRFAAADTLLAGIRREHPTTGTVVPPPAGMQVAEHSAVCLVEYRGAYQLADLAQGWSPEGATSGSYAVVIVKQSNNEVLVTVLLRHNPLRFARQFPPG